MQRFLEQARARKLDRVAAAYAVAAWLVVQGASIAFPAFGAPGWALQAVIVVAIVGLPVALAIAWHIAGPEGSLGPFKRLRRLDTALLILLGAAVSISAVQLALSFGEPDRAASSTPPRPASIAVLPFVNMSGDPARDYFSDGISEELLNSLANTSTLKVAARTSSFAFKGRNIDVKEIGRILNVSAVLEGSVREEGNRVRITAQLIDTSNGYHMWSQTYDRDLKSILAVQEEIARDITVALTHRLSATPSRTGRPGEINPDAFRKYLEGQFYLAQRTRPSIERSIALFEEATKLAPNYADAFGGLGVAHAIRAFNHLKREDIALAAAAAEKALALDPDNVPALSAKALVATMNWDWAGAHAALKRARSIAPNNAQVLHYHAVFYAGMDLMEPALGFAKSALAVDPLSFIDRFDIAAYLLDLGRYEESLRAADHAAELAPASDIVLDARCRAYSALKQFDAARRELDGINAANGGQPSAASADCAFHIALAAGRKDEARRLVAAAAATIGTNQLAAYDIASAYVKLGEYDKAMDWYERSYDRREQWLLSSGSAIFGHDDFWKSPRWLALMARPEARAWKATRAEIVRELAAGG